jgi:hypothetical protein
METEEEYNFINKTLQSRKEGNTEWFIGLIKKTGVWKWVNNHSLTINRWQPRQPSGDRYGYCVIMAKNYPPRSYGLFNDLPCGNQKRFICEYRNGK